MAMETPDYIGCVIARILTAADVTALAGTRISASLAGFTDMPRHAVLIRPAGGFGELGAGLLARRVDVSCYGSNDYEALRLARRVEAFLIRPDGGQTSFIAAGTVVQSIGLEGGPNVIRDVDTGWSRALLSFVLRINGVGVAA